jgi:hypothetical protein
MAYGHPPEHVTKMPALSEYSNVYNTALLILKQKGFQVWFDESTDLFGAEKDGWDFLADTPCGLLGVVAIFEHTQPSEYREHWWREQGEDLYSNLPRQPRPYTPVWKKR